ncbi:MAG: multidrug effflux MFS transporter [Aeromonas sp.]
MSHHTQQHPNLRFATLLAMTMALGPFALDTYLPAFPAMAQDLGCSVHEISLSISVYVFVLAFGQLVAGPLSDRIGRANVMLSGLLIFAMASALLTVVSTLPMLLLLRAVQAFGAGWAIVCVPALVRDRLHGREAAKFFSLIGLIGVVAPALAPSVGSTLLARFAWPGIFVFLALYGLLMALLLKRMVFVGGVGAASPQSHPMTLTARYGSVLANRPALRFLFIQAFSFSVMLLFITHASFIYQQHFGATPGQFSLLFGANMVVMLTVNIANRKLLNHFTPQRILALGLLLQGAGLLALILVTLFAPSLWLFLPAMMLTVGVMGAITPNTQACFMEYFTHNSGTAAALIGAAQFLFAGVISAGSALLPGSVLVIVLCQAACSAVCLLLLAMRQRSE